jgi:AraC-like DNA-binding protein
MKPADRTSQAPGTVHASTVVDADKIFGKPFSLRECQDCMDGFEVYWHWPEEIGNGFLSLIKLRPGLLLGIGNYHLSTDTSFFYELKNPVVSLGFSVSGNMAYTVDPQKGRRRWGFKHGCSCMSYSPERHGIAMHPGGTHVGSVGIFIAPSFFSAFMGEEHGFIPHILSEVRETGAQEKHFYRLSTSPPHVNMVLQQILNCPYRGRLKRLFLEGKTLELMSHHMASVYDTDIFIQTRPTLRPGDIEPIRKARGILARNLETPPSLKELARRVGINKNKLNKGFRQIFGTSVFEYLRTCRLERARELLESKKMNVTQVAFEVGYAQHSNFTRAFKRHFGFNPEDYLR